MWTDKIKVGDHSISYARDWNGNMHVLVSGDDDLTDPDFFSAVCRVQELLPLLSDIMTVNGMANEYYRRVWSEFSPAVYKYTDKVEHQDQITVSSDVQEFLDIAYGRKPQLAPIQPAPRKPFTRKQREGFVYLLQSETGEYKIGRTVNPENRQKTFGIQLPFRVEFLHLIKSNDYVWAEKQLHERYAEGRKRGEWFDLTDEQVAEIQAIERLDYGDGES